MEKMQEMTYQPQILIREMPRQEMLLDALSSAFAIPREHVFLSDVSANADYDELLRVGYAIIQRFKLGDFECRVDAYLASDRFNDESLHRFSKLLEQPVVVDFSTDATDAEFIAYWNGGKTFEKIWEEDDDFGNPFYRRFSLPA